MSTIELIHGDCIAHMRSLATGSVDALIGDPPYELTNLAFDKQPFDWAAWWPEALRVCKPTAPIVLFSQQPFTTDLIMSNRKAWRYELIWDKGMVAGFLSAAERPLRAHEHIQVFCQEFRTSTYNPQMRVGKMRKKGGYSSGEMYGNKISGIVENNLYWPTSVIYAANTERAAHSTIHPTQKPLDLMTWLTRTYSNPGDLILDPWAGSGTTLVACIEEGRNGIGVELDVGYYAKAQHRITLVEAQQRIDWSAA